MVESRWRDYDYFSLLLNKDKQCFAALEYLVDDLHSGKDSTVSAFLHHAGSEDFLWALVKFLGNHDPRVAGNSAYILGTLAESEIGRYRVISLTESRHHEREQILPDLVCLLSSSDSESVMNAAGTIGTLAESDEGREWLLSEPCIQCMVEKVTNLLADENTWTASNAALVLARLTISEKGCDMLLDNVYSCIILSQLVMSLGTDEAGRGMNSAFAIGRLCDTAKGRSVLLHMSDTNKMVTSLAVMLCSEDSGSSKNACFAISCLAASSEGHDKLSANSMCDSMLITLSNLLVSDDFETGWFSAMTLKTFASRPQGCVRMRELGKINQTLHFALKKCPENEDMIKEVKETIEILKPLEKPEAPKVMILGPRLAHVTWQRSETKSGLPISYRLFEGSQCVYTGVGLETTLTDLTPSTQLSLRVRASVQGDESPFSEVVLATTQEDVPGPPDQLSLLACTATQLKIGWSPPTSFCGAIKFYYVYLDNTMMEHTGECSCILSGLKETTSYDVSVCASTSKGKGEKASLLCITASMGDHTPSKPVLTTMGRNEINVAWNAPPVPLGRITRYDVSMNGRVIHSGTELHCTARQLTPNTDYTFVVTVVTNEGKLESKSSKKRTAKDEFENHRAPLYVPPIRKDSTSETPNTPIIPEPRCTSTANQVEVKKKKKKRGSIGTVDKAGSAGSKRSHASQSLSLGKRAVTMDVTPMSDTKAQPDNSEPDINSQSNINASDEQAEITDKTEISSKYLNGVKSNMLYSNKKPPSPVASHRLKHYTKSRSSSNGSVDTKSPVIIANKPLMSEPEPFIRSMTKLNMNTYEPMLPPAVGPRSKTFTAPRSKPQSSRNATSVTVTHIGNPQPIQPELPARRHQAPPGRFIPMQFRTQPVNLPNVHKYTDGDPNTLPLRRASTFTS